VDKTPHHQCRLQQIESTGVPEVSLYKVTANRSTLIATVKFGGCWIDGGREEGTFWLIIPIIALSRSIYIYIYKNVARRHEHFSQNYLRAKNFFASKPIICTSQNCQQMAEATFLSNCRSTLCQRGKKIWSV
jgi:hypothetical protein